MTSNENFFGCFFKVCFDPNLSEQDFAKLAEMFRDIIWGEKGICNTIKILKHQNYGKDLELVLFQFYLKPTLSEVQNIKEIESYRKNEKSIGVPIIVNDDNFFDHSDDERRKFLKQSVLQKLEKLSEVVKKRKLDTNIDLLRVDLKNLLNTHSS